MFLIPAWKQTIKNEDYLKGAKIENTKNWVPKIMFSEIEDKKVRLEQNLCSQMDDITVRVLQRRRDLW